MKKEKYEHLIILVNQNNLDLRCASTMFIKSSVKVKKISVVWILE